MTSDLRSASGDCKQSGYGRTIDFIVTCLEDGCEEADFGGGEIVVLLGCHDGWFDVECSLKC